MDDLVQKAALLGQPGIALTDHGNVYGAVKLFDACRRMKIRGVIGMEAYEAVPHAWDLERDRHLFKPGQRELPRYFHLTLWAMNLEGWENLCALHSRSYTAEYKPGNQPLIDRASLEDHSGGLMVGLGCIASRTNQALQRSEADGLEAARWYAEVFGDRAYVEVMANTSDQQALLRSQRRLALSLGLPVIATNDVHYLDRDDGAEHGCHHALVQARRWKRKAIEGSSDKSDAGYGSWYGSDGFYLKDGTEMLQTGGLLPEEVDRTGEVIDRCSFDLLDLPRAAPPRAPIPGPGEDPGYDLWLKDAA